MQNTSLTPDKESS